MEKVHLRMQHFGKSASLKTIVYFLPFIYDYLIKMRLYIENDQIISRKICIRFAVSLFIIG